MIRHIFKIIWNERRSNSWLALEYTIVFCVLWFCCDYGFSLYRTFYGETGVDLSHTYSISMDCRSDLPAADPYETLLTIRERVGRYPGVEAVAFGHWSMPFGGSYASGGFAVDSDTAGSKNYTAREMRVTPEYFEVFRIGMQQGHPFGEAGVEAEKRVVVSPFDEDGERFGEYGSYKPIFDVRTLRPLRPSGSGESSWNVSGVTEPLRISSGRNSPISIVFYPLSREEADPTEDIMVRVKPDADKEFAENFTRDMRRQLTIGPYFLLSVTPIAGQKEQSDESTFHFMKGVYAIMGFLMVNIFLGLLGSFWFRVQARRSEIGLRVALGSPKRGVRRMIVGEVLLLLTIASLVGTVLCLNLSKFDLIEAIGIPIARHEEWGIGAEQNAINFVLTFAFLAVVSVFAVWYPARKASENPPAEALRDE